MKELEELAQRAERLRRAALQTRLRLAEQRAELERVAGTLKVARLTERQQPVVVNKGTVPTAAPVTTPLPAAARTVPELVALKPAPVTVGSLRSVPLPKEAVAAAPSAAPSLRKEAGRHAPALLATLFPFLAIGAAAMVAHAKIAPKLAVVTPPPASAPAFAPGHDGLVKVEPPAPAEDDGSAEALLLVHEWKPSGDGQTVLEMLGGELDRPGLPPAWTVERTGPREFLVRFRDGAVTHAFEADLAARSVRPAGETAALFAGR